MGEIDISSTPSTCDHSGGDWENSNKIPIGKKHGKIPGRENNWINWHYLFKTQPKGDKGILEYLKCVKIL